MGARYVSILRNTGGVWGWRGGGGPEQKSRPLFWKRGKDEDVGGERVRGLELIGVSE